MATASVVNDNDVVIMAIAIDGIAVIAVVDITSDDSLLFLSLLLSLAIAAAREIVESLLPQQ